MKKASDLFIIFNCMFGSIDLLRTENEGLIKLGKNRIAGIVMAAAAVVSLTLLGCGSEDQDVTSVSVNKNGEIDTTVVEDFDKDYYSLDDLAKMSDEEVSSYNSANGAGAVKAGKPSENKDKKVIQKITYASYNDYAKFNNSQFFCGTVADASAAGYNLGTSLKDASDSAKTVTGDEVISQMKDKHILITDEATHISVYGRILYVSEGVTVTGRKAADISKDMDGTGYIIFE